MYIYELPVLERMSVCRILDQNNKWEELGGIHMQYDDLTVKDLKRVIYQGNSPTEELLTMWGNQNHTVVELFILLSRMKHYQAMSVIKNFVDPNYHTLIQEGEQNLQKLINDIITDQRSENVKIPKANLNETAKILNVPGNNAIHNKCQCPVPVIQLNDGVISREDNESIIVNQRQLLQPRSPLLLARTTYNLLTESEISSFAESVAAIPQISYEELQQSTNNWRPSSILGRGGFGTVFKGTWKCTQVAIKRIEQKEDNPESHSVQIKQSITELHCLNAYRHDNVLPLYGYSIGGPQPCLVYQYMPGGCLEHRLRIRDPNKVLKWPVRLNIAIGTARGLQFLHTIGDKPLIHGDIKSANILLDPTDTPRIGDFGLAREGPISKYTYIKVSRIHGTRPYLPDEFLRAKKVSTKVDTYSFGVVLFEIATALGAFCDTRENKFLRDHVVEYGGDILDLKDGRAPDGERFYTGLIDIVGGSRWKLKDLCGKFL